ncbi:Actin- protein 10 [Kappamyces sp. JEL0680]|nr:Actin- protein 10 [Kappamyces sp. JEL0680]
MFSRKHQLETRVVVDFGSLWIKIGFAGESSPRFVLPAADQASEDAVVQCCIRTMRLLLRLDASQKSVIVCEGASMSLPRKRAVAEALFRTLNIYDQTPLYHYCSSYGYGGSNLTTALRALMPELASCSLLQMEELKNLAITVLPPDGTATGCHYKVSQQLTVFVDAEVGRRVGDQLFQFDANVDWVPIHLAILATLKKCPIDTRRELAHNILLTGGLAMIPGMAQRIGQELERALDRPEFGSMNGLVESIRILKTVWAPHVVSWIGASLLADSPASFSCELTRDSYLQGQAMPDWTRPMLG